MSKMEPMKDDVYNEAFRAVQGSECVALTIVYFLWPRSREVGGIMSETHRTLGQDYIPF